MSVHRSAIVSPKARLAEEVEIGPYSVVGDEAQIGRGCVLQAHVIIEGAVEMGENNFVGHGAVIGGTPQDLSFSPETRSGIRIGNGNIFREQVTIHRGTAPGSLTTVGNDNFLMVGAHVGHNCDIGNKVIIANNCLLGGYVSVADGAFLGGGSVYHQFTRIGRLAITQGNSGFGKDLPPFVVGANVNQVVGLNVVGLRRAGLKAEERAEIRAAFQLLFESGLNVSQALAEAATRSWSAPARSFFNFVAQAKRRGICGLRRSRETAPNESA